MLRRREIQRAGASGEICPAALTAPRLLGLWERARGVAGVGVDVFHSIVEDGREGDVDVCLFIDCVMSGQ
jgi:hypothetical protein